MKALWGAIFVLETLFFGVQVASAQTWTQTSAPVTNWTAITCSADGVNLAAFAGGGLVYTSTNSGNTWNPSTNAPNGSLQVASSADGTKLVAAVDGNGLYTGGIYRSLDSGVTWTQTSAPSNNWVSIASSADGNKLTALAAAFPPPDFYTSSDGGNTWHTNASPYDRWGYLACSADGSTLVACGGLGTMLVSTNFGNSWTTNIVNTSFNSAASSATGDRLMVLQATANIGTIYISTNWGLAWNQIHLPFKPLIGKLASSADGSKLVAVGSSGPIYVSTNFGVTWTTNTLPGINSWSSSKPLAVSADGNEMVAAVNGGGIWICQTTPSPQMYMTPANGNLLLSWIVPSMNFALEQNSDLTTTNWTIVTNRPILNLTNLHDEVTLPLAGGNGFYQLVGD